MKRQTTTVVSRSATMKDLLARLTVLAKEEQAILFLGEPGTGKSRLAKFLQEHSLRSEPPLLEVSYDPYTTETAQDEIFGIEKEHPGALQGASGGTILIDELRSLSLTAQGELLSFVQKKEIRGMPCDVRVLLLTHLGAKEGLLGLIDRKDIKPQFLDTSYFTLVEVPPLRERREDIPDLCLSILSEKSSIWASGKKNEAIQIAEEALWALMEYDWPKNISELKKEILEAQRKSQGVMIERTHLSETFSSLGRSPL